MAGRFYDFPDDPNKYVSVTTFLGIIGKQQFLMPWAAKMERELIRKLAEQGQTLEQILEFIRLPKKDAPGNPYGYALYTEEASEWGNVIHKAIDYTLKGLKLPKLTKAQRVVYDKWKEWWSGTSYELLGAEQVVKCKKHLYAGTLDARVVTSSGGALVLDWKTGKNHYDEHVLQNLAYQYALVEDGKEANGGELVYIPRDKEIWTVPVETVTDANLAPALAALDLWRWANRSKKKA